MDTDNDMAGNEQQSKIEQVKAFKEKVAQQTMQELQKKPCIEAKFSGMAIEWHENDILTLFYCPDGTKFVSAGNNSVCIRNTENWELIKEIKSEKDNMFFFDTFSPDGEKIIAATEVCIIHFINISEKK